MRQVITIMTSRFSIFLILDNDLKMILSVPFEDIILQLYHSRVYEVQVHHYKVSTSHKSPRQISMSKLTRPLPV